MYWRYLIRFVLAAGLLMQAACTNMRTIDAEAIEEWHCGQQLINTRFVDGQLLLTMGEKQYVLAPVVSASGTRYQAGEEISLWFEGWEATLQLRGRNYPVCVPPHGVVEPYRAAGNEPFWSITLNEGLLTFRRLGHESLEAQPYTRKEPDGPIIAGSGENTLRLLVKDGLCRDTMSDMHFPQQVELELAGKILRGCGGDSARLLQGVEWVITDIDGTGVLDGSRVTLVFETDGRVNGRASCNRFMGRYTLTGEGLSLDQLATTKMACAPALMDQEKRVLTHLGSLMSFEFREENGALLLRSDEGFLEAQAYSF